MVLLVKARKRIVEMVMVFGFRGGREFVVVI